MSRKLHPVLLAALAAAMLASGCGGDDDKEGGDAPAAVATAEATPAAEDSAAPAAIDETVLREFIDAVNEDPALLCDPDNVTAELLETIGGEETCRTAAAEEPAGDEYTIDDITIDGDTATATITDADSTSTVTFVTEGDQIKVSSTSGE